MRIDNVIGGKIKVGNIIYNMKQMGYANRIVWGGEYTYTLTDVVAVYSSGTNLLANQTNYAYLQGTYNTYLNDEWVSATTVTCTAERYSDSHTFINNNNQIVWNKPTYGISAVTANYSLYNASYSGVSYEGTVRVNYGANTKTPKEKYTGWTAPANIGIFTSNGGNTGVLYGTASVEY